MHGEAGAGVLEPMGTGWWSSSNNKKIKTGVWQILQEPRSWVTSQGARNTHWPRYMRPQMSQTTAPHGRQARLLHRSTAVQATLPFPPFSVGRPWVLCVTRHKGVHHGFADQHIRAADRPAGQQLTSGEPLSSAVTIASK